VWFNELTDAWETWQEAQPKQEGTWNVQRGIASRQPFKKPPKSTT
jgi:hypothetical protein